MNTFSHIYIFIFKYDLNLTFKLLTSEGWFPITERAAITMNLFLIYKNTKHKLELKENDIILQIYKHTV
jgi:hypothetical protein